jgi:hypothetical protein
MPVLRLPGDEAKDGEILVGNCHIIILEVEPCCQNQGKGTRLLKLGEDYLRDVEKCSRVHLLSTTTSRPFYINRGYKPARWFRSHYLLIKPF